MALIVINEIGTS